MRCGANMKGIFGAFVVFQAEYDPKITIGSSFGTAGHWNSNVSTTPSLCEYYKKQDICWCPEVASTYIPAAPLAASCYPSGTSYACAVFYGTSGNSYQNSIESPTDTIFLGDGAWDYPNSYLNAYHGLNCGSTVMPELLHPDGPTQP